MEGGRETADQRRAVPLKIRDAFFVWLAGFVAANIAFAVAYGMSGGNEPDNPEWYVFLAGVLAQFGAFGVGTWLVCRVRGTGSLRHDVGLVVRAKDWWRIPAGSALLIGLSIVLLPLTSLVDDTQEVVEDLEEAGGAELAVLAITAGVLAPVFEELLFRGLLLRALLHRYEVNVAIAICAIAFGVVHLSDFSLGTLVRVPALIAFGAVSAVQAVRTGELSRSILLHVGFNLVAVAGAVLG